MHASRMHTGSRNNRGFTLIELLIVIVIIGIIASLLIPNLLDALQKAKQKRTMADARFTGTAMMAWLTDVSSAAAAGQTSTVDLSDYQPIGYTQLHDLLVTRYIQVLVPLDGWKHSFEYYLDFGQGASALNALAIRSPGRDGQVSGSDYLVTSFAPTDYDQDIVWTDGYFVRWPVGQGRGRLR